MVFKRLFIHGATIATYTDKLAQVCTVGHYLHNYVTGFKKTDHILSQLTLREIPI